MGTRPEFEPDRTAQQELLDAAAALSDDGSLAWPLVPKPNENVDPKDQTRSSISLPYSGIAMA